MSRRFNGEQKARAVERHVTKHETLVDIAADMGCTTDTVRSWVRAAGHSPHAHHGPAPGERRQVNAGRSTDAASGLPSLAEAVQDFAGRLRATRAQVTVRLVDDGMGEVRLVAESVIDPTSRDSAREAYSARPEDIQAWALHLLYMLSRAPHQRPIEGRRRCGS